LTRSAVLAFVHLGFAFQLGLSTARAQPPPPAARKSVRAARADTAPAIDGVLDDAAWQAAEPIADFVQQEPRVNEPVSEPTEVRVLYDGDAMYFGIRCDDRTPAGIVARELRRDNPLAGDDRFEIVLDTFHDHRNGYYFVINPLGTQYDAEITNEGLDINVEWDERWWAATRITDAGWTAEIKIPLTSLRSAEGADTWGVNFKRFIRRKNETAQWTAWDRDFKFVQVSQNGHLTGLPGLRTGLRLRIKPYVLGGGRDTSATPLRRLDDVGLEVVKFSLTPGLTAELTVNTDFAQTEVDEAVVNLTRFPLFFPEKREFFLERAGIFEFGPGGRRGGAAERNLQMFFSRRIGLTEDRREVPIVGGGKLTGRAGGFDVGLLNVQTERFEQTGPANYTVLRAKRNVLARSSVGLFVSNRQTDTTDYNRVFGADANFTVRKNTDVTGFVGKSWTPGRDGNDWVGRAKYNWLTDQYEVFLEHLYVGPDFQHDVGFVRRRDVQRTDAVAVWQPRPGVLDIRNLVFRGEVVYTTDIRRTLLTREEITQATSRWQSDDAIRFNSTNTFDRLQRPFEIARGITIPVGDYEFRDNFFEVEGSGKRAATGRARFGAGDFYGGKRRYVQLAPSFKPMALLSVEAGYEFNDVSLREGDFTTHVFNARVNFNLSNRLLTTTLAQYDSASKQHVLFFRLNYIYRPGDDLFVVFNRSTETSAAKVSEYTLLVKLTYSLDF
jgi:uncharacterized protein DUF5916/cellulose/xylan binding protein with CBM9 domain